MQHRKSLIDHLDALERAATPGPWAVSLYDDARVISPRCQYDKTIALCGRDSDAFRPHPGATENAALIVALRNNARAIVDFLRIYERPFDYSKETRLRHAWQKLNASADG
jgi:hypothetical protein